jgi:hypothetical protein
MVTRQRKLIVVLAAVAALALVYTVTRGKDRPSAAPAADGRAARSGSEPDLPRVGLDRVRAAESRPAAGQRDVFAFGAEPRVESVPEAAVAAGPPPELEPTPIPVPTPTPLPALTVKYIGSLEKKGLKVAFFLTEKKEVVSGQAGETVMNRFRVVRIGFESVDVQQVGAEQVQRLPLKGN